MARLRASGRQEAKPVIAEVVPEEDALGEIDGTQFENTAPVDSSGPWSFLRKMVKFVAVGTLCLAMVQHLDCVLLDFCVLKAFFCILLHYQTIWMALTYFQQEQRCAMRMHLIPLTQSVISPLALPNTL